MEASPHPETLVGADRPFFTTRESLDDIQSLSSVSFASGDLSIGRYRRDRPGHGVSTPNPISPMVMAVVILRPRPAHVGWHDDRLVEVPALGAGALNCLDLREAWSMDLSEPFDSFHGADAGAEVLRHRQSAVRARPPPRRASRPSGRADCARLLARRSCTPV